jgi:radical SAM protein with 4Fe4S-binding SPASM domain
MATKNLDTLGYPVEDFVEEYIKAFQYIVELNLKGIHFIDYYSTLLVSRILTPFSTGFMDLQSPAGAGISGVMYDFNGDVYPTDEGRMLARVGDFTFRLGNVLKDDYKSIFNGEKLRDITSKSILQTTPGCANCILNAYCGNDPIRNYVESGDTVGYRPGSDFCKKNKLLIEHLIGTIKKNDNDVMSVLWSWITNKNIGEIRV